MKGIQEATPSYQDDRRNLSLGIGNRELSRAGCHDESRDLEDISQIIKDRQDVYVSCS